MMKLENYIHRKKIKKLFNFFFLAILIIFLLLQNYSDLYKGFFKIGNLFSKMYPFDFKIIPSLLPSLLDTVIISFLASFLGIITTILILPFTNNLLFDIKVIPKLLSMIFSTLRTIPSLIIAAILVSLFSVGIFSGFISLYLISFLMGMKMLKEYTEEINKKYIDSCISLGFNKFKIYKVAILDNIKPVIYSVFFLILESNIRGASVLGLVGAGGIGQILWKELNHLRYDRVSVIIILLVFLILIIDTISFLFRKVDFNKKVTKKKYIFMKYFKNILFLIFLLISFYYCKNYLTISSSRIIKGYSNLSNMLIGLYSPDFSYLPKTLLGILESVLIAFYSTLMAGLTAIILSYFATEDTSGKSISIFTKIFINIIRTFPPIIIAILFFRGFGPGFISSFFALYIYTLGIITKMFSDILESIDKNIIMSIDSMGISKFKGYINVIFKGYFPEFLSISLLRFEMNIKNSTILGMVGVGGIGQLLSNNIEFRNWSKVSIILISLSIIVIILENISYYIREKIKK